MDTCLILVSIIVILVAIFAVNIMGFSAISNMMYSILMELKKKEDNWD